MAKKKKKRKVLGTKPRFDPKQAPKMWTQTDKKKEASKNACRDSRRFDVV